MDYYTLQLLLILACCAGTVLTQTSGMVHGEVLCSVLSLYAMVLSTLHGSIVNNVYFPYRSTIRKCDDGHQYKMNMSTKVTHFS